MGQINYTISIVLFVLFALSLVVFVTQFSIENNAYVNLGDDPDLNFSQDVKSNMSSWTVVIDNTSDSFYKLEINERGYTSKAGGEFKASGRSLIPTVKEFVVFAYRKIFGSDTSSGFYVFVEALVAVLGLIMILYMWKTWIGRNPD